MAKIVDATAVGRTSRAQSDLEWAPFCLDPQIHNEGEQAGFASINVSNYGAGSAAKSVWTDDKRRDLVYGCAP